MSAYRWVTHSVNRSPILKSVPCAIVLIMEDSPRYNRLVKMLSNFPICRHVILQYNKGYRSVPKKGVDNTSKDILHATSFACHHAMRRFGDSSPVLVLEDDVSFRPSVWDHARHIDEYISCRDTIWDIYSLGSIVAYARPFQFGRHITVPTAGCAHAWVFHPCMSVQLQQEAFIRRVHARMDTRSNSGLPPFLPSTKDNVLSSMCKTVVYFRSVATQPHVYTQNSRLWMNPVVAFWIEVLGAKGDGALLYNVASAMVPIGGCIAGPVGVVTLLIACICYRV